MYSFDDLLNKNLPVCVRVENLNEINTSWPQQIALFFITTTACLSGITALSYYTYVWELHTLKPLGADLDPMLMVLNALLFVVSVACLAMWLQEDRKIKIDKAPKKKEDLNYIFPQSHSLHIGQQAWDLNDAHSIIIDYPFRVIVEFRSPNKTFVLIDDQSGFPSDVHSTRKLREMSRNGALFVYLTGVDLPSRYILQPNWWWNVGAGIIFVVSTMLPFLFQAIGFKLYWISFLAIPLSYLIYKVGQKEFQKREPFAYSSFINENQKHLDKELYRPPLI